MRSRKQIEEQWLRTTWTICFLDHICDTTSKFCRHINFTYVHPVWKGSINNDDMKNKMQQMNKWTNLYHHHQSIWIWLLGKRYNFKALWRNCKYWRSFMTGKHQSRYCNHRKYWPPTKDLHLKQIPSSGGKRCSDHSWLKTTHFMETCARAAGKIMV